MCESVPTERQRRRRQCFKTFNYSFTRGVTNSRLNNRCNAQKVNPSIEGETNRQILSWSCSLFTSINLDRELFSLRGLSVINGRVLFKKIEEEPFSTQIQPCKILCEFLICCCLFRILSGRIWPFRFNGRNSLGEISAFVIKPRMPRCKVQSDFSFRWERSSFFLSFCQNALLAIQMQRSLLFPLSLPPIFFIGWRSRHFVPQIGNFSQFRILCRMLLKHWMESIRGRMNGIYTRPSSLGPSLVIIHFPSDMQRRSGAVQLRRSSSLFAVSRKWGGSFTLMGGAKESRWIKNSMLPV